MYTRQVDAIRCDVYNAQAKLFGSVRYLSGSLARSLRRGSLVAPASLPDQAKPRRASRPAAAAGNVINWCHSTPLHCSRFRPSVGIRPTHTRSRRMQQSAVWLPSQNSTFSQSQYQQPCGRNASYVRTL